MLFAALLALFTQPTGFVAAEEPKETDKPKWTYDAKYLRPFWEGDTVEGESVLFIKDPKSGEATARVLFPISKILAVRNSAGDVTYEEGIDYRWQADSREIVLPKGSRITSVLPGDLRRPANSQKYKLTHRDGNGEIFFGGKLEYHDLQTCITYQHAPGLWHKPIPQFDENELPRSVFKLLNRQPIKIVVLGDSISAGANASALGEGLPYQPAYPELLQLHLHERFRNAVDLVNLSVGGKDSAWGASMVGEVVKAEPDLVIIAFGMNDSAGRPAAEFQRYIQETLDGIRKSLPDTEFILVATMTGNRDWITLKPELFPQYRDALAKLRGNGIALADLTTTWEGFLERKHDWDQTGNGVNHPNDFGHRVYTQAISALLDPKGTPSAKPMPELRFNSGPLNLIEKRLLGNYTYSYACAAYDLDADGDLDLTSSDAEPNSNLYLLLNQGNGTFQQSFIQKFAGREEGPIRMERHAIGDLNRDGLADVVIVDNLNWDIRWFEHPKSADLAQPWSVHRVCPPKEVPGAYDVSLADVDADGDMDIAASSWRFGNRFDWFENVGTPGNGSQFVRHEIDGMVNETRTVQFADFNQDGRPDVLGTGRVANQICWYENGAAGGSVTWTKHLIDDKSIAPAHGHPADVDADGDLDVVMAFGIVAPEEATAEQSHQIAWYENVGKPGTATQWKKHLISADFPQGFEATPGDLDGDGDLDVVATAWGITGQLAWFENTGNPTQAWNRHLIKADWPNAVTVIVADLNGDGRLDVVACAERGANEIRWWKNNGPAE